MKNQRLNRFIRQGGIVAYPTESCFGLGCDPKNKKAINKIIKIKKRMRNKNFILIGSSIKQFNSFIKPLNKFSRKNLFSKKAPHPSIKQKKKFIFKMARTSYMGFKCK